MRLPSVNSDSIADAKTQPRTSCGGHFGDAVGEFEAVTGFIARQAQPADELVAHACQRGLVLDAAFAIESLVGHAIAVENGGVRRSAVQLLLRAEELQRAQRALVVPDAGGRSQRHHAVAAVLSQPHHAALVDLVARRGAIAQHRQDPADQVPVEMRAEHQWAMVHRQPSDRLQWHARPGPWRRVAGRDLSCIGEAGFQRRAALALDQSHLVAIARQFVGRGGADDSPSQDQHFHRPASSFRSVRTRCTIDP